MLPNKSNKMKPTKMRNQMIYQATYKTKSKQLGSALSKDLHKKYGKRSVRVVEGDGVTILRGEFKGVDGKIAKISTQKSCTVVTLLYDSNPKSLTPPHTHTHPQYL